MVEQLGINKCRRVIFHNRKPWLHRPVFLFLKHVWSSFCHVPTIHSLSDYVFFCSLRTWKLVLFLKQLFPNFAQLNIIIIILRFTKYSSLLYQRTLILFYTFDVRQFWLRIIIFPCWLIMQKLKRMSFHQNLHFYIYFC